MDALATVILIHSGKLLTWPAPGITLENAMHKHIPPTMECNNLDGFTTADTAMDMDEVRGKW